MPHDIVCSLPGALLFAQQPMPRVQDCTEEARRERGDDHLDNMLVRFGSVLRMPTPEAARRRFVEASMMRLCNAEPAELGQALSQLHMPPPASASETVPPCVVHRGCIPPVGMSFLCAETFTMRYEVGEAPGHKVSISLSQSPSRASNISRALFPHSDGPFLADAQRHAVQAPLRTQLPPGPEMAPTDTVQGPGLNTGRQNVDCVEKVDGSPPTIELLPTIGLA